MEGVNSISRKRFPFLFLLYRMAGIPLMTKESSKIQSVYNAAVTFSIFTIILALFKNAIDERHDLKLAMKSFRMFLMSLSHFWVFCLLRYRRKDVEKVLILTDSFTWNDLPTRDADTEYVTMIGMIPRMTFIFKAFMYILSGYQIIDSARRIMINKELVFATWYPFDSNATPYFQLVNATHVMFITIGIGIVFAFPMTYILLVCITCGQLQKLRNNILKIGKDNFTSSSQQYVKNEDTGEREESLALPVDFENMQLQINECIRHHQKIIEIMQETEVTINIVLCGHFLIIFCILCFNAFYAVMCFGDFSDLLQSVVAHGIFLSCLLVFCWFGNQLTIQAESVRDAAFGCNWIGTPISFQKCILFIIATANKEFTFTAGKFVPVSNKTLMTIMNQTLSFFMFLLEVKRRIEEPI